MQLARGSQTVEHATQKDKLFIAWQADATLIEKTLKIIS
jgi:hypothetical protein